MYPTRFYCHWLSAFLFSWVFMFCFQNSPVIGLGVGTVGGKEWQCYLDSWSEIYCVIMTDDDDIYHIITSTTIYYYIFSHPFTQKLPGRHYLLAVRPPIVLHNINFKIVIKLILNVWSINRNWILLFCISRSLLLNINLSRYADTVGWDV